MAENNRRKARLSGFALGVIGTWAAAIFTSVPVLAQEPPAASAPAASAPAATTKEAPPVGAAAPPPHASPGAAAIDPATAAAAAERLAAPSTSSAGTTPTLFAGFMDPFDYDPRGRRDPFSQPIQEKPVSQGDMHGPLLPLQAFELNQLRLTGIIWDVKHPKAIIKDPNGTVHVIGPNAKIGPHNGYVAAIREGEIVVVETIDRDGRLFSTAQVVKIGK